MINTMELSKQVTATGKRSGGREGRRALRGAPMASFPTLVRNIPTYQMVPDEAVELIHDESMKILEEIGCEFRDDEAISMWKAAGADVQGTRVRIDRALLMDLIAKVPPEFTLNARNPERTVKVGGKNTVFVPMYGAPYVRGLDGERRYGSLADLNNLHKLAYMSPALHSSSSIICEPMEVPVPKRHLHIIHSALKHSDKPFMGIVTSKERAEDVMKMAGIVFGEEYVKDNTVVVSITNCNSPLVWDATMLDAMKVYARHNQPLILAPFALCGASTSASSIGAVAQVNAEALAGVAFTQLIRPGSPQIYGQFMVTVDMKTGAPMGGTPEAAQMMFVMGALARKYKLPWRTSGFHVHLPQWLTTGLPNQHRYFESDRLRQSRQQPIRRLRAARRGWRQWQRPERCLLCSGADFHSSHRICRSDQHLQRHALHLHHCVYPDQWRGSRRK